MTEPTNFEHHSTEYKSAVEASQTNAEAQYEQRDVISYAAAEVAQLEFDVAVEISKEWATLERKPNNETLRAAEASTRLKARYRIEGDPYRIAVDASKQANHALVVMAAAENKNASFARLHMRWMQYETALLNAVGKRG